MYKYKYVVSSFRKNLPALSSASSHVNIPCREDLFVICIGLHVHLYLALFYYTFEDTLTKEYTYIYCIVYTLPLVINCGDILNTRAPVDSIGNYSQNYN